MIEIEKKFSIRKGYFERLTKDAEFVSEKTNDDTYYDKRDYSLTKKGVWLRFRNGNWELKSRLHEKADPGVDQYEEIDTEEEIRDFLKLEKKESFAGDLKTNGYFSFCSYKTLRKKYRKDSLILDFDLVDFEDFSYEVLEIELMVRDKSEIAKATKSIIDFAKENDLETKKVWGKAETYLRRYDPKHFQVLVRAGVMKK
jgi:adenylate cyclase class IV